MMKIVRWSLQLALLSAVYFVGEQAAAWSGLPIPGTVLGVVLLFLLLLSGLIRPEQVEEVANFLLKHLMFFFIPIAAGLMNSADLFLEHGLFLFLAIVISAAMPLWVAGALTQLFRRRRGECKF